MKCLGDKLSLRPDFECQGDVGRGGDLVLVREQIDVVEAARAVGSDHRDPVTDPELGHPLGRAVLQRHRRVGREAGLAIGQAVAFLVAGLGADIEGAGAADLARHVPLANLARGRAIDGTAEADPDAGERRERGLRVVSIDAGLEFAHREAEISPGRTFQGCETRLRRERRITDVAAQPAQLRDHGGVRSDAPQGREAFAEAITNGREARRLLRTGRCADPAVTQLHTELEVLLAKINRLADDPLELADGLGRAEEGAARLGLDPLQNPCYRRPLAEALQEGVALLYGYLDLAQLLDDFGAHRLGSCGRFRQLAQEPGHGIRPFVGGG